MNRVLCILLLLLLLLLHRRLAAADDEDSPMMLPSAACTDQLVVFSSCLPFISASPNNRSDFPPPECCADVSDAFTNGSAICVCYLILEPDILGFPLNASKLLSLTSFCPRKDQNSVDNVLLQTLCSDSATLPPLRSITSSSNTKPPRNTTTVSSNPPSPPPPPKETSGGASTEQPADEWPHGARTSIPSSTTHKIYWLSWTVLSFFFICPVLKNLRV